MRPILLSTLLLLGFLSTAPHNAHAQTVAGFAPGPVWVSTAHPTAGTAVRISTVVYNGGESAIEGSVSFLVDSSIIGSSPFTLEPGASTIESVSWTPSEGSFALSAAITSAIDKKTKAATVITQATTSTITTTVLPAPPKPEVEQALDSAQSAVASSTPVVQGVLAKATEVTESLRTAGLSYLTNVIGSSSPSTTASSTRSGTVLGAETEQLEASTSPSYQKTIARTLLPLFTYPALFYPVLAGVLGLLLWLLLKKLRNPKPRGR